MRKIVITILILFFFCTLSAQKISQPVSYVDYVNPLMGTDSDPGLLLTVIPIRLYAYHGDMNFWMPQTGRMGDGWAYQYTANKINGFKQTHQPSPWMNDYGMFSLYASNQAKRGLKEEDRAKLVSHKAEIAKPYYYKVYLADDDVTTEIAPAERAASFRFTFPKADSSSVIIDALDRGSYVKIIPAQNKILVIQPITAAALLKNFKNYFVIISIRLLIIPILFQIAFNYENIRTNQ